MSKTPSVRLALGADGVSVWSPEIFGNFEPARVREFLARAFAVREVSGIDLQPAKASSRIRYGSVPNPSQIWKKLGRALSSSDAPAVSNAADQAAPRLDVESIYLGGAKSARIRVTRIGNVLSTWTARQSAENRLSLAHPLLRKRRDVVFRLEEELAGLLGVEGFRTNALTGSVSIRFDATTTTVERLVAALERAWPRLLEGFDGPPSNKRLVASAALVGLAFTGQYVVPALRPLAVASVALYSAPNVVNGAKQLARGRVGLPVLYSTGLSFMLISGLPFTASVMATFMQAWPFLSRKRIENSQRRLFAAQRRRPTWARVPKPDGSESELGVDKLHKGDLVVARRGDIVPVDGVVIDGFAALVEEAPFNVGRVADREPGDGVHAGAYVRDGTLTIRVERDFGESSASQVDSLLPRTTFDGLPSSVEAERIAERNVKPTLALAAASLFLTRSLFPAQALIRPDYATGPRISAQLSALRGIADGWQRGVLFRSPSALDRLPAAQVYVLDDSVGLERRTLEVVKIDSVGGVSTALVLGYAFAVHGATSIEQAAALRAHAKRHKTVVVNAESVRRYAGTTRYQDGRGNVIELARPTYIEALKDGVPKQFRAVLTDNSKKRAARARAEHGGADSLPQSLWVLRNDEVIGVISFADSGEPSGGRVIAALTEQNPRARIVYLSRASRQEARVIAERFGVEFFHGGLDHVRKAKVLRKLGGQTLWVGDGSEPEARELIAASAVSISVAPLSHLLDAADVLLPYRGVSGVLDAIDLGRAHAARLARDYRAVYAANLLGAAAAVLTGLSPLQVGLLSNLGTGLIYARHARALERAATVAEKQRAELRLSPSS